MMGLKKAKIECAATTPTIWYQVTLMLIRYITKYMHITFKFLYHQQFVYNFFVCFNNNIKEPIFYKNSTMTWVANELILEAKFHFFLECMRVPPDWHLWVYFLGDDHEAEKFQVTITLFREEEYGRMGDSSAFSAQRSYTGPVSIVEEKKISISLFDQIDSRFDRF